MKKVECTFLSEYDIDILGVQIRAKTKKLSIFLHLATGS